MHTFYMRALLAAALAAPGTALAQTTAPTAATSPAATAAPNTEITRKTLFKLGSGLTRGFELSGFNGLSVPVVLGAETHLSPAFSVYGDVFSGWHIGSRYRFPDGYRQPLLSELGADVGVRYYYNQEKRRLKGRATGPFIGNYLAVHTTSTLSSHRLLTSYDAHTVFGYEYSSAGLLWGLQRRIGGHGLLDAYTGLSVTNPLRSSYRNGMYDVRRYAELQLELGVKISLIP